MQEGILDEAKRITGQDRNKSYGEPSVNFNRIALLQAAWRICRYASAEDIDSALAGVSPHLERVGGHDAIDVTIEAIMTKIARIANGSKRDNWVDIAGYARCGAMVDGTEAGHIGVGQ